MTNRSRLTELQGPQARLGCAPDFRIGRVLGKGGNALVYDAVHEPSGEPCALKVVHAEGGLERFRREVEALWTLDHPHIIDLVDAGENSELGWLAMERADDTLMAEVEKGPLATHDALRVIDQVAAALGAAHGAGIVHRDVKPSNLLRVGPVVKIADFGVARFDQSTFTGSGARVGTRSFMAPEQGMDASSVGSAADVYGLGASLYAMITRKTPEGLFRLKRDHFRWRIVRDPRIRLLLLRTLQVDPLRRPSLSAFRNAVATLLAGST